MIKAALFDIDGIVIVGRTKLFSHALAERQEITRESVEKFFLGNFKKCSFGKADLKEEIAPFLSEWGWQGTVEDLLKFWFESDSTTSEEVLTTISALRSKGVKCYMATRQEKYRLKYLLDTVGLKDYFDGVFCTCDIGYDKKEPEFLEHVFKTLQLKPQEILYFDDNQSNIDSARSLGVEGYFYNNIEVLKGRTKDILM